MTNTSTADLQEITVFDADKNVVTTIKTNDPQWSFDQYVRNRENSGWSWE